MASDFFRKIADALMGDDDNGLQEQEAGGDPSVAASGDSSPYPVATSGSVCAGTQTARLPIAGLLPNPYCSLLPPQAALANGFQGSEGQDHGSEGQDHGSEGQDQGSEGPEGEEVQVGQGQEGEKGYTEDDVKALVAEAKAALLEEIRAGTQRPKENAVKKQGEVPPLDVSRLSTAECEAIEERVRRGERIVF